MRPLRAAAALLAAAALAACMDPATEDAAPAEPTASSAFEVLEESGGRLVVAAGGRPVAISPPEEFCVEPGSVRDQGSALFLMIGDCAPAAAPGAMTTLSLTDKAMFGADRRAALDALAEFLDTDAGRESAGMGGEAAAIRILATRRTQDALYVLVEDSGAAESVFGPRVWRAFTELNGRACIVSLGVAGAGEDADTAMLLKLSRIVGAIQKANGADGPAGAAPAAPAPAPRPVG